MLQGASPQLRAALGPDTGQLACLCDSKQAGGELYFRLSHARVWLRRLCKHQQCSMSQAGLMLAHTTQVLAWLKLKARAAATILTQISPAFAGMEEGPAQLAYSVGLIGEYLSPAWQARLQAACNLPAAGAAHQMHACLSHHGHGAAVLGAWQRSLSCEPARS